MAADLKGGAIVNMASAGGHPGWEGEGSGVYNASKAAVLQITRSMALEFALYKIRVNNISPGFFPDDLPDEAVAVRRIT